ncbi:MAG: hypothetical protein JJE29_09100 [Peptostreptococcaceae bacterium]|nr:hypothetical protein [Peptostreptococcaceae bacterium]
MRQVVKNAKALAEALEKYGFRMVTGGTDNHLLLVNLRSKGLTGKQFDEALESAGITVNKNMIPNDPEKPMVTSGVRIGVTAMTIKGAKEDDMRLIANLMNKVADNPEDEKTLNKVEIEAIKLSSGFPLYEGIL